MIVSEPRADIAAWVGAKIGVSFEPPYTALAHVDRGRIIAAYVFNVWTGHDVEVSLAADRLSVTLMRAAFRYVVEQLGCRRATFRTRSDNMQAQKALDRLGAQLEGRQRGYFGDCDALLYGILKEDFPYGLNA
ncbi:MULTISPECIES: GNAT family N-acetyltransferase [Rhizobium]|uniref:GNAT family N-acetyltransferase n=1 Tax=Rhizobium TaxID=379 RepID=UPI001C8300FB|nr:MULTISPECIES: GNAT family protein [Rhizobium]MBX4940994.1 GNAT family N-acetyltransferase [Rhizobium binae]MBX4942399.1 GNAT family N-acetyltransferase [Rhizobium binae]MBX4982120.1 GNAT family N-acetyltransferase [Rhizobium binae]MBY3614988.1 GNAT family N-acetyltransferase [Rhizobium bangladeshense]